MNWLKNNYGYILLAISMALNCYCFFYKPKTTGVNERLEIQAQIDSFNLLSNKQEKLIAKQELIIDSVSKLKRKPVYIKSKISKKYEKDYIEFIGSNDSVQLYLWTKQARQ